MNMTIVRVLTTERLNECGRDPVVVVLAGRLNMPVVEVNTEPPLVVLAPRVIVPSGSPTRPACRPELTSP